MVISGLDPVLTDDQLSETGRARMAFDGYYRGPAVQAPEARS
jgi:hypothetical protein